MRRSNVPPQSGLSTISALIAVLVIVVLALVSIYAVIRWRSHSGSTAPPTLTLEVIPSPEDSEIFIDGKSAGTSKVSRELPSGKHDLRVTRRGYRPWQQTLEAAGLLKVPVNLEPLPMDLRILPGQDPGQAKAELWLDNELQVGSLDGSGESTLTGISQGTHSIRIKAASGESTVSFDFRNGNPAAPALPEGGPAILFVSSSDGKVRAECNCKADLRLRDSSQPLEPGSAATFTLAEGRYSFELEGLPGPKKVVRLTVGPTADATMAFFWPVKETKPVLNVQSLLNSSVNLLKDSKCNAAQANVDRVLSLAPSNADALGLSRRIARLRSVGGCL